jgi:hypothetical protein
MTDRGRVTSAFMQLDVAVWLGLHSDEPAFAALDLIRGEKAVFGSFAYTDVDFRRAIRIAAAIDPSWVATFALDRGAEIFSERMNGRTDVVKAQLTPASVASNGSA